MPRRRALAPLPQSPGAIAASRAMLVVVGIALPGFGVVSMLLMPESDAAWPFRLGVVAVCVAALVASYRDARVAQRLHFAVWLVAMALYAFFLQRALEVDMPATHAVGLYLIYMLPLLLMRRVWEHLALTAVVMGLTHWGYSQMASPVLPEVSFLASMFTLGLGGSAATLARVRAEEALQRAHGELEARVVERTAQLEEEVRVRRAAETDALRASRAKSSFLANMSHELRTPLNAITGYAELVQDELMDSGQPELADDLDKVRASAAHLLRMVSDVLDLSRIEAGELTLEYADVGVAETLEQLARLVESERVRSGANLTLEVEPGLCVHTDAGRLAQIALNLMTNALKFTGQGQVRVEARAHDGAFVLAVHDTGIGIATDDLDRIFQTFVQVDGSSTRRMDGSGLGLALSRDLAKRLGGTLTARSALGEGSTFTLRLPDGWVSSPSPDRSAGSGRPASPDR